MYVYCFKNLLFYLPFIKGMESRILVIKKVIVLHDFDGRPYYKGIESSYQVTYLNTRPFRFFFRDLIKTRKISKDTIASLLFLFSLFFHKDKIILLAMAPFNWRMIIYRVLSNRNKVYYHTSWHDWQCNYPFSYLKFIDFILMGVWKKSLSSFHECVTVTNSSKMSLLKFFPQLSGKISQVYHVVDSTSLTESQFLSKWNLKYSSKYKIGYVGRLEESKGINVFLSIVKSFNKDNLEFHVIGSGRYEPTLRHLSKENDNFYFHGYVGNRNDIHDFYSELHFLLVPSLRTKEWEELFGVVVIEAMNKGVVVICTDHVGPNEIIDNNVNGYILTEGSFHSEVINIIHGYINSDDFSVPNKAIIRAKDFQVTNIKKKWVDIFDDK